MDLVQIVGGLLSQLHAAFPAAVCPGGWAWTTTVAGALIALLPTLGAMLAALVRRWTGNDYGPGPLLVFGVIGLTMTAALPWLAFLGTSEVFRGALRGRPEAVGLSRADLATLGEEYCFAPRQVEYLGGARTVREVITSLSGGRPAVLVGGILLLALLPLLSLLFVAGQARLAFRRGPRWPARLLWLPLVLVILGSASLSATVVAHLWLGFLPVSLLGMIAVALVGAPRWSVIENRAGGRSVPPASLAPPPLGGAHPTGPHAGSPPGNPKLAGPPAALPPGSPPAGVPHSAGAVAGGPHAAGPYGTVRQPPAGVPGAGHPTPAGPVPMGYAGPLAGPPRRGPTAPPGVTDQPGPPNHPVRALAAQPGPLPETLQRALGVAGPAASPVTPSQPEPPTLPASRFQRIRPLGSGGFGTVWLAKDTALDRTVAVKAAKAPDDETERRIRREARALAAVHHPHCVRIYDILTDADGELAIVMEYVPGRPLNVVVEDEGPLYDVAAGRLWSTLAGALHAAHGKGVLHRDVKPSNIIIDEAGYPHLIDFGIARATGDVTLTAAGMVVGTPDFMPPEVAAGKPASPASDAWQLAATVSYALSGLPPRGHRDGAVAAMLAAAQGQPCNQLPQSSIHRTLLEHALHPEPAHRPGLPIVQSEITRWLSATGQQPDAPVTQQLRRPAWPSEDS